jgi:signal transduction histidine kinase
MSNIKDLKLDNQSNIEFFGRISASISHELNNVISIIDQVSGLLEDNLAAIDEGYPIQPEQLERIHKKISIQTSRGIDIIKRLNKFSHSTDHAIFTFDLKEILNNLLEICERFADLKRVPLSTVVLGKECQISSSPFLIQQVLYYILNHCFDISNKQSEIQLELSSDGNLSIVSIKTPIGESVVDEFDWIKKAITIAESIEGKVFTNYLVDDHAMIEFHIPTLI